MNLNFSILFYYAVNGVAIVYSLMVLGRMLLEEKWLSAGLFFAAALVLILLLINKVPVSKK